MRSRRSVTSVPSVLGQGASSSTDQPRLAQERLDQQRRASSRGMPRAAQVEQRRVVELADGGAVRGLHLVGVDHQHRLGVDLGVWDSSRFLFDSAASVPSAPAWMVMPPWKHRAAALIGQAAPGQFAAGVAGLVFDAQAGVEVAAAVRQQHDPAITRRASRREADGEFVARQPAPSSRYTRR